MTFTTFDHECMARAMRLAQRGLTTTMPNPRVGCVLAREGRVIGEGWHERAGKPHAEINALRSLDGDASGATAYVTLEPCAHQGRTGPCAQALINAGVGDVVFAVRDPNPEVAGQGASLLAAAGIGVREGLMEAAARELNVGFFSRMVRGRPWVRVKLAQSLDGRTALATGESAWITGTAARQDVQQWRARACAILSGIGTVLADNPSLNVRLPGSDRQPLRVIADSHWRMPARARTLSLPGQVLLVGRNDLQAPHALPDTVELLRLAPRGNHVDLRSMMTALADREVNEVHVEAGARLAGALLDQGLLDELLIYQAPIALGSDGAPSLAFSGPDTMEKRLTFDCQEQLMVGQDLRMRLRPQYCED